MLFSSSFLWCGAGYHLKVCLTCFCCPASSLSLGCLICGNWPSNLGLEGLSSDVHQLSRRTQLTRVLLQHLIFDRTLNNRLIALCAYLYQQQHSSQCRWNWEVTCRDNDKLPMFHMSTRKWWWQLCGTLKPDASCIPDTAPFNLLRAVLDFAVLCMTSCLAVTLWDSLLLRISEQNWSAGFRAVFWTHTDRPVYFSSTVSVEKNLHFLSTGDQAKLPGSITEILINVLYIFWMHNDCLAVDKQHVLSTETLGQQEGK